MVTFFAIFAVLVLINAALLISSILGSRDKKVADLKKGVPGQTPAKILPLDFISSKYKKAI
ncbi:hypothetical protein [Poritiphilus flavus]|uniref:Uncharacterized protein n=1 Tax=Poritiphilus flavus TaxID=2697053 RepID=A0A6L9E978_9FLAO|nr:hypothetical protein [Poritiphilus flavus]NAS11193.1 hypothetical protein [Poritiphilus flavus]